MLYTELQLWKSETTGEMFSIKQKVALAKGSAQEGQPMMKKRLAESSLPPFEKLGKNWT